MGKYGNGLTSMQVGKLEAKEANEILKRYRVPLDVRQEIVSMIKEGYFQLSQICEFQNRFSDFLKECYGIDTESLEVSKKFINWSIDNCPGRELIRELLRKGSRKK